MDNQCHHTWEQLIVIAAQHFGTLVPWHMEKLSYLVIDDILDPDEDDIPPPEPPVEAPVEVGIVGAP